MLKNLSSYNFEKINFLFKIILIGTFFKKSIIFMSRNLNSNNTENDDVNVKNEDGDYKDLITKLKGIKSTIALLEKTIFK